MFSHSVEQIFDSWISNKFKEKTELKNFLLKHERKKVVIENACYEIVRGEKYNVNVDANKYKFIIETVAEMFCKIALQYAEESARSDLAKMKNQIEQRRLEDAQGILDECEKEALSTNLKSFGGM